MNQKNMWLLILGLGLTAGTIVVDRFIVTLPDWLAIGLTIIAIVSIITFIVITRKQTK